MSEANATQTVLHVQQILKQVQDDVLDEPEQQKQPPKTNHQKPATSRKLPSITGH